MRFAIYGAGAIGAYLGANLSRSGEEVALIARGPHLAAMKANGVTVRSTAGDFLSYPFATDNPKEIGEVDYLILAVKAHGLRDIAPMLSPMLGPDTAVLPAQNGIPWWYFHGHGSQWKGTRLNSVDPDGTIERHITYDRVIGCVVYPSAIIAEPGVVEHIEGDRFSIGELDGLTRERCRVLSNAFAAAGLRAPIRKDIRQEIWVKLLGNMAFNPISALTKASLVDIVTDEDTNHLARLMMAEAQTVAERLSVRLPVSIDQRIAGAMEVGEHKTSMLQDIEAAKPTEIEGLVGTVLELGRLVDVPMPCTSAIYACTKLLGAQRLNL